MGSNETSQSETHKEARSDTSIGPKNTTKSIGPTKSTKETQKRLPDQTLNTRKSSNESKTKDLPVNTKKRETAIIDTSNKFAILEGMETEINTPQTSNTENI